MTIKPTRIASICTLYIAIFFSIALTTYAQSPKNTLSIDEKVKQFLETRNEKWIDMNIPASDGQQLYDLIIKNNYKKALEIGTSTGHSAIWMAWALSKTGGKLLTVEIDIERYNKAIANFKEAGLTEYIEARLGDAHKLIPLLSETFDFVFCDADKNWYKNYFMAISPNIATGGTFVAHNVANYGRTRQSNRGGTTRDFFNYVISLPNYSTTVNNNGAGMSISLKTGPNKN